MEAGGGGWRLEVEEEVEVDLASGDGLPVAAPEPWSSASSLDQPRLGPPCP